MKGIAEEVSLHTWSVNFGPTWLVAFTSIQNDLENCHEKVYQMREAVVRELRRVIFGLGIKIVFQLVISSKERR